MRKFDYDRYYRSFRLANMLRAGRISIDELDPPQVGELKEWVEEHSNRLDGPILKALADEVSQMIKKAGQ